MTQEKLQKLTLEQKCDVAQKEMDDMREDLEKLKDTSERVILNLKVSEKPMAVNEIRIWRP